MTKTRSLSGVIVGYDPGGAEGHGVATLVVEAGKAARLSTTTVGTTEQVIKLVERTPGLIALGIDTLTCWSTGPGGWRPATTMSGMRRCPPSQRWRACPAVGITICTPFRRVVTSAC